MNIASFFRFSRWVLLGCLASTLHAQRSQESLGGEWRFALDPVDAGVEQEWFQPALPVDKWDKVTVPHCYSVDRRYHEFTGPAWYRKTFTAQRPEGARMFLHFDAVFYTARVWLNGIELGAHEGGYTPFEFDVTDALQEENCLVVRADNAWSRTTLPGAKTKVDYQSLNYGQMYPWMNYGGITRAVFLVCRPALSLDKVKVETVPDLATRSAALKISAVVKNRAADSWDPRELKLTVSCGGKRVPISLRISGEVVAPGADGRVEAEANLTNVQLWSLDRPVLYRLEAHAASDALAIDFGVRKIEIRGTRFYLNGEALSLGGANRPLDAPGYGSMDPPEILERDLRLMKAAGMELSRIDHYPVSTELLDWADAHGMLIIAEAGNWQMTPAQMSDPMMRGKYQSQAREMIERDWNHPSVIAWSLGNEFPSQTEEGQAWVRDMRDFTRSLDDTRLITFASNIAARPSITRAEDEASQYVDFVSANIYENHLAALQRLHALFPGKPVYVSEFGMRADAVADESERVAYLRRAMADFRQCADWLMGASIWTLNDYASIFPGSNPNGYRPWGLVTPERAVRGMYRAWQEEFSPAILAVKRHAAGGLEVTVVAREDFPRRPLHDYRLRVGSEVFMIETLSPGETRTFQAAPGSEGLPTKVTLESPGGFPVMSVDVK